MLSHRTAVLHAFTALTLVQRPPLSGEDFATRVAQWSVAFVGRGADGGGTELNKGSSRVGDEAGSSCMQRRRSAQQALT